MRRIREVVRLQAAGLSRRQMAKSGGIARSTVAEYLKRAETAVLSWPLPEVLNDTALEAKLFPPVVPPPAEERAVPDWAEVNRELKRKGVTLALLWDEYKAAHPEGYQYSWFCGHYRAWLGKMDVVMRQDPCAGEKRFVDYAGQTMAVVDRHTGGVRDTQLFVAVLGASNYTFAEATLSQTLPDWIGSHGRRCG